MKKLILIPVVALSLYAKDRNFDGYSYFAIGNENFQYSEKFMYTFNSNYTTNNKTYLKGQQVAVKSKINVNNPVYLSGGLIRFKPKWDLSMDFASTLKPNVAKEKWLDRSDDSVIVENYSTIMSNSMKFLLHYKITNSHRVTMGVSYILNIFKRFNDPKETGTTNLVEETSATGVFDIGYWYESNTAAKDGLRIKYELTAGIPFYQNVTNTAAPDLKYNKAVGFNLDSSLYAGYPIFRGLEVGVFGSYSYMYREGEEKTYHNEKVIWPTNITQNTKVGLLFSWKFD